MTTTTIETLAARIGHTWDEENECYDVHTEHGEHYSSADTLDEAREIERELTADLYRAHLCDDLLSEITDPAMLLQLIRAARAMQGL